MVIGTNGICSSEVISEMCSSSTGRAWSYRGSVRAIAEALSGVLVMALPIPGVLTAVHTGNHGPDWHN